MRDLMEQQAGRLLDALGADDERLVGTRQLLENRAGVLRRGDGQQSVAACQIVQFRRGADAVGETHAGWVDAILVATVDCSDDLGFERPDQAFAAVRRGDLREGRAPCAAADDPNPHAFTPAPRTFSALSSSGQRARAGASRPSINPAAKRSAPAQAIIAALSVHSQPGGTLKPRPLRAARPAKAQRNARLAATPPATTRVGASLDASANAVRSIRQSTTAC